MRSTLLATLFLIVAGTLTAQGPAPQPAQPDPNAAQPDPKAAQPPAPQPDPKTAQPPVPQPPAPQPATVVSDYFPTKKGTKWTYKYAESDVLMDVAETGPEIKVNTVAGGKVVASETLKLLPDGIYRTKINNLEITGVAAGAPAGLKILDMVAKDGKLVPKPKDTKWSVDVKVQQASLKGEYKILDTVKLKTPAGEFDVVPVVAELNIGGTATTVKYWFALGKGQVKVSYSIAGNEQSMELKAFEEGK